MKNLSRVSQLYILGIILLGGIGGIWSLRYLELEYPIALVFACVLATLLQILKIEGATARSSYSLSWVVYAAVFVGMGWPEMLVTITVAHLGEWLKHRYPWYIQSFNIANYSITTIAAGLVYEGLNALPFDFYGTRNAFAILIAMLVFTVVNHLIIGLVIKLARGQSFSESGVFTPTTLTIDFGLLCLGASAAIVAQTNVVAIVFIVIVVLTLQSALRVPALEREAERTAELARTANAKYEFVATMNHELRTPLNAVLLYAESLQRRLPGPLNERQERAVRGIQESAQHLLAVINDILDAAKIDAGKLGVNIISTDVEPVCQSSLLLVSEMAQKKQLDLHYDHSPSVTRVDVDEGRLKQMLVNLLSNAIKFTPEGGKVGLEVSGDMESNIVHFAVWDTGIGLCQEDINKLFQPFVQLNIADATHFGGTGLGLFLVHRMAELHGGSVSVTSEVNQGSRFTISLPWYQQRQSLTVDEQMPPVSTRLGTQHGDSALGDELTNHSGSWRHPHETSLDHSGNATAATVTAASPLLDRIPSVLIADDNEAIIRVLSDFLQAWRCHILIARTGIEAVQQTKEEHPDLVLMDIQMPEMNGLDAIHQIRAEPSLSHIPIIVLTASALADREQYLAAGADDYLSKPVQVERLTEILDAYLGSISAKD
jgi:signal transduction histidine kinase/ActR/RegA family two-component response regulator